MFTLATVLFLKYKILIFNICKVSRTLDTIPENITLPWLLTVQSLFDFDIFNMTYCGHQLFNPKKKINVYSIHS